jgi:hypothetical protein
MNKYKDIVERLVYYSKGGKPLSMNHPIVEDSIDIINRYNKNNTECVINNEVWLKAEGKCPDCGEDTWLRILCTTSKLGHYEERKVENPPSWRWDWRDNIKNHDEALKVNGNIVYWKYLLCSTEG